MNKFLLAVGLTLSVTSYSSHAVSEESGNFFVQGYGIWSSDNFENRDVGAGAEVGFQFTPDWALYTGYQHYSSDLNGIDGALVGGSYTFTDNVGLFSQVSWHDDAHWDIGGGLEAKYALGDGWSLMARVGGQVESGFFALAGLRYDFDSMKTLSVPRVAQTSLAVPAKVVQERFNLDVKFPHDSAVIKPGEFSQVEKLALIMDKNPSLLVTIEGHTSLVGSESYNQALSERRAAAVKKLLVARYGVDAERVKAVGYGESRPVALDETTYAQSVNRRVMAEVYYTPGQ